MAAAISALGLIGTAIASALLHQQRYFRHARDVLGVREGIRDAVEVLSTDLRSAARSDTIRVMSDSAVEFFAGIGGAVVCRSLSPNTFALSAESASGATLTSFHTLPDTGDLALLYVAAPDGGSRAWERHRILAFAESAPLGDCLADGSPPKDGYRLTLAAPPVGHAGRGVPVRFIRRGRYSLYRASDREWYLGYRRCNAVGAGCGGIQPVSGPYRRHSVTPAETGFLFEYFDARGDPVRSFASPLDVARVEITARAQRPGGRIFGAGPAVADSGTTSIALRNR
jgi:hypothetical protein